MSEIAVAEPGTGLQNFLDRAGLRGFPWKTATILYTISWGWLFIVRDSLWAHDWDEFAIPQFAEFVKDDYGLAPWTLLEFDLFNAVGPSIFRYVTFVLFLGSSICVFGISGKVSFFNSAERKVLALLFLLLPFHTSRVALMVFKYTTAYFLFFTAWYLVVSFRHPAIKMICAIIFFLSFQMHSLLFFYLLPVIHLFFLDHSTNWRLTLMWCKKNLLLLSLPIAYFVCRTIFWPETNGYHTLNFASLQDSFGFVVISVSLCWFIGLLAKKVKKDLKKSLGLISLGFFTLFVGILPYVLYGYFAKTQMSFPISYLTTTFGRSNWNSRHLILQPLGSALVIIGVIESTLLTGIHIQRKILISVLSLCVVFNAGFGFEYVVDHVKQEKVITSLEFYGDNKDIVQIQFIDQTTLLNARGQKMYPNSWSGLIWRAYGFESARRLRIEVSCETVTNSRLVLIQGPETHWQALKNWVSDGDMGFKVTVDDMPGACKPEMVTAEKVSGAIPILFYFIGAKG